MATDGPTVLVVDDESAVRLTLAAMLAHHGYEPVLAAGGAEAVELCRARTGTVAAVVLDVRMPGMDGPATLDALRALEPALPCVFVSGENKYADTELLARGAVTVLVKPVGLEEFGRAVTAAIAPPRS
ncbi:MAG: response regulator [Planctomycetes bacterium]|nr:response regulator [Planctomycetota bacterium]